jgi:dATP pyrophosphohydrolase
MRAPFQILAVPYKFVDGEPLYCVLRRSDSDTWQFIAGGGEDSETYEEAARREILEESGILAKNIIALSSVCSIPREEFPLSHSYGWDENMFVIPEYSFGFKCLGELSLSKEHTECVWLPYETAREKLKWDSNKTALYELNCILSKKKN